MFKLNFKENLKSIVKDQVNESVDTLFENTIKSKADTIQDIKTEVKEELLIELKGPLHTDKYLELIDIVNNVTKEKLQQPNSNLFTAKSVLTVAAFLFTSILVQLDAALLDSKITMTEGMTMAITLLGSISTIAARGSEGKEGVFTPKFLPGLNKEDFDDDGISNDVDETPYG